LEKHLQGSWRYLIEILSQYFLERLSEITTLNLETRWLCPDSKQQHLECNLST